MEKISGWGTNKAMAMGNAPWKNMERDDQTTFRCHGIYNFC